MIGDGASAREKKEKFQLDAHPRPGHVDWAAAKVFTFSPDKAGVYCA